jgi:hypothetical protein
MFALIALHLTRRPEAVFAMLYSVGLLAAAAIAAELLHTFAVATVHKDSSVHSDSCQQSRSSVAHVLLAIAADCML